MDRSDLANRMKTYYEQVPKTRLIRRIPVIIRIDGKAFHTFTKGFMKPFDEILIRSMQETMMYLCKNIQGCVLGYAQSDEISLVLIDYQTFDTQAWLDYEVQKMCSITASMATMTFNKVFLSNYVRSNIEFDSYTDIERDKCIKLMKSYANAVDRGAMFDARCFNIPKEEVVNYIYWRQLDATRNSIQMVGQANFSHKELQYKSCNDIQDMLMVQKSINWNDFPVHQKRGSCCIKDEENKWIVDKEIPIFKGEDRNYIEDLIFI